MRMRFQVSSSHGWSSRPGGWMSAASSKLYIMDVLTLDDDVRPETLDSEHVCARDFLETAV